VFGKVVQKNTNINKEGIGLGLYITRCLVVELGGTIEVSSEEGSYTSFVATLPVV
jgi:signal transduction histidine kinase